MKDDRKRLNLILERFKDAEEFDRINREASVEDALFANGEQWPLAVRNDRENTSRPCLTINQLPQFIRQISGEVRLNKPAIKVRPVDDHGDLETARVYEGLIRNIEDQSHAGLVYSIAADNAARGGIGHFRFITQYADDDTFDQDIRIESIPNALAVVWDHQAIKPDRSDARFVFVYSMVSKEAFEDEFPDAEAEDFAIGTHMPDLELRKNWYRGDLIRIAEYWVKKPKRGKLLKLEDGRVIREEDYEKAGFDVPVKSEREVTTHEIESYIVSGSQIVSGPHKWAGKHLPIVPVLGEEVFIGERMDRSGIVRHAKDSQRLLNYARSMYAETIGNQPRAPWLVTQGMIGPYKALWDGANASNPPYLVWAPDPAAPGAMPQRINPPAPATGLVQEFQMAVQDLRATTGIYDAALGARSNETSGIAIEARQEQADIATFLWKDNLNFALKTGGMILIDLIQQVYSGERIVRILGEDGQTASVPVNKTVRTQQGDQIRFDLTHGKYDVTVDSGPNYSTKRKEASAGMLQFVQAVPEAASVVGDLIAKNQDWPNADEVARRLQMLLPPQLQEGAEQQPPPEDPAMAQAKADMELKAAAAEQDMALARQKAEQDMEIARMKVENDIMASRARADNDRAMKEREAFAGEVEKGVPQIMGQLQAIAGAFNEMAGMLQGVFMGMSAPSVVVRDASGDVIGTRKAIDPGTLPPGVRQIFADKIVMRDDDGNIQGVH